VRSHERGAEGLRVFLESVIRTYEGFHRRLIAGGSSTHEGTTTRLDIGSTVISEVVIPHVMKAVQEHFPTVLSPGTSQLFLLSLREAHKFIAAMELFGQPRNQRSKERGTFVSAASAFMKMWNTSVYASMRFQDIAGECPLTSSNFMHLIHHRIFA